MALVPPVAGGDDEDDDDLYGLLQREVAKLEQRNRDQEAEVERHRARYEAELDQLLAEAAPAVRQAYDWCVATMTRAAQATEQTPEQQARTTFLGPLLPEAQARAWALNLEDMETVFALVDNFALMATPELRHQLRGDLSELDLAWHGIHGWRSSPKQEAARESQ